MTIELRDTLRLPCGATLPNRLAKAAMSEGLGTPDNHMTEGLIRVYERWAEGGIGLNITGNIMIDRRARAEPGAAVGRARSRRSRRRSATICVSATAPERTPSRRAQMTSIEARVVRGCRR